MLSICSKFRYPRNGSSRSRSRIRHCSRREEIAARTVGWYSMDSRRGAGCRSLPGVVEKRVEARSSYLGVACISRRDSRFVELHCLKNQVLVE